MTTSEANSSHDHRFGSCVDRPVGHAYPARMYWLMLSGMGELLKQHQMKKPVGVKSVKPSLTCSSGSIRCKSSSQIPLAIQHTSRYRAYAQLHLEAVPASLSVHTFPHTVAVHGMSIATSQSSLPQSDSIASRIYTTDSALGSAKVSTRLWPPELENMAEVTLPRKWQFCPVSGL